MDTAVLIVDDQKIFRMGVNLLISEEPNLHVVGEAGDGETAINQVRELAPDVVIMDINMPDMDGIEATRQILSEAPETKIITLSIHGEKEFVEDMLRAGATSYILKESAPEDLVNGIHAVLRGELFLSKSIKDVVLAQYVQKLSERSASTAQPEHSFLLTTKLHPPRLTRNTIVRNRLLEQLEEGRERPLTLISAPAGYGKSILVSQWLESCDCPGAWLSLDKHDNDLHIFLSYLVAALQTQFPEALSETAAVLQARTLPPLQFLVKMLVNDLECLPEQCILVLDDYHHIYELAIHTLLGELLRFPPRTLHLVLVSRTDPALDLLQMRAYQQIGEVRALALSFTVEETAAFLESVVGSAVDRDIVNAIDSKIEGWVTGLHLISLSVSDIFGLAEIPTILPGEHQTLDFLVAEALSRQPRDIQAWLLKTSFLERFCAPLCEAVCASPDGGEEGFPGGEEFIRFLRDSNLFVIPLDHQNRWFRYHHLFQQLLQDHLENVLDGEEIAALRSQAAAWFAENGLIDEALNHSLVAGDIAFAVKLIEQHRYNLMNTEQWNRLERWLKTVPPETVQKNPVLLSTQAYLYDYQGRTVEAFAYCDRAEALLLTLSSGSSERKALQGEIMTLRGVQYILAGEVQLALENSKQALALLPANAFKSRSAAIGQLLVGYQMAGDINQGVKTLKRLLKKRPVLPAIAEARKMLWYCFAYWMDGDLTSVKEPALRCLKLGEQHKLLESLAFGRFFLGIYHYARNELAEAVDYLHAMIDNPFIARTTYLAHGAFTLALIHHAHGREEEASSVIESVIARFMHTNETVALETVRAAQVELALLQGKLHEAQSLNKNAIYDLMPPIWFLYVPQLTPIKLLIEQNTAQSLEMALNALDELDEFLCQANRNAVRIDLLALKSLIFDAQGKEPAAFQALAESLTLAERGGFIRNYVDLGPKMADLLARAQRQGVAAHHITLILAAFPDVAQEGPPLLAGSQGQTAYPSYGSPQMVGNSLTGREREVLRLLATQLTTKEIAEELTVSMATIRSHTKHIYSKLDAHSRMDAVIIARDLGLLQDNR